MGPSAPNPAAREAEFRSRWLARDDDPTLFAHCRSRGDVRANARAALLLLHGFNSAPGELYPQAEILAEALNAHVLAPRLPGHGSAEPSAMRGITPEHWIAAVDAAFDDAKALSDTVVVVGSSLGGSLAIELASRRAVTALVLWSPGVRAVDDALLARFCAAGDEVLHDTRERTPGQRRWNRQSMHADGFRALRDLFARYMVADTFARVSAPAWMGYYYLDAEHQDVSSRVDAMLAMFEQLGTDASHKIARAFPDGAHNLASPELSPASAVVVAESEAFLRGLLA